MDHGSGSAGDRQGAFEKNGKPWFIRADMQLAVDLAHQKVSGDAIVLLMHIESVARDKDHCWPSNGYFAKLMDTSDRSIRRYLGELKAAGAISTSFGEGGQRLRINLLRRFDAEKPVAESTAPMDKSVQAPRTELSTPPGQICPHNKDEVNKDEEENKEPPYPPKTSIERNGQSGGFVGSFFLREDPGTRKEDARTHLSPMAIEYIGRYFGDKVGRELASSQSKLIKAAGSVLAAHAAITATVRSEGDIAVRKPVNLMIYKAKAFAEEGVPTEMIALEDLGLAGIEGL